jgi:hypothetical protein
MSPRSQATCDNGQVDQQDSLISCLNNYVYSLSLSCLSLKHLLYMQLLTEDPMEMWEEFLSFAPFIHTHELAPHMCHSLFSQCSFSLFSPHCSCFFGGFCIFSFRLFTGWTGTYGDIRQSHIISENSNLRCPNELQTRPPLSHINETKLTCTWASPTIHTPRSMAQIRVRGVHLRWKTALPTNKKGRRKEILLALNLGVKMSCPSSCRTFSAFKPHCPTSRWLGDRRLWLTVREAPLPLHSPWMLTISMVGLMGTASSMATMTLHTPSSYQSQL